jgi:CMP-N-acetylneuraminate monooxygenase
VEIVRRIELGSVEQFLGEVSSVEVANQWYYLVRTGEHFKLFSRICPHKGGVIRHVGGCFECPQHGWRFDLLTGEGRNTLSARLAGYDVTRINDRLYAELPIDEGRRERTRAPAPDLTVAVHAHACLEFAYRGFSLLVDPWLKGTAFLGSWVHYPRPVASIDELKPDAVLITHEHSDHFHLPTLAHFERETPVYAPDFPNRRILSRLEQAGFCDVRPLRFGETVAIAPAIKATAYEPSGVWNDAIVVIDVAGFRILNLNDAGINHRIAALVKPVDVLASQFSIGASGYPWAWSDKPMAEKVELMRRAHGGRLEMLRQAVELYGARYLLPFASYFGLWHPSHAAFMEALPRVTFDEVRGVIGDRAGFLPLLPGSRWNAASQRMTHRYDESDVFDARRFTKELEERFDRREFDRELGAAPALNYETLSAYLLRFNEVPEIVFCENLSVSLQVEADDASRILFETAFRIDEHRLSIVDDGIGEPNLTIRMPQRILGLLVAEELSWDEAHVGYWGDYRRQPDIYTPGFWRMLQAPYYKRPHQIGSDAAGVGRASDQRTVAALIDRGGERAERVMRRYGLYCGGCHRATYETLQTAAEQHGLNPVEFTRLVAELDAVLEP